MSVQVLGLIAGALVAFASLPQFLQIVKTKQTKDISLQMYVLLNVGGVLWVIYGLLTQQLAVIVTNLVFELLNLIILILKLKHG